MWLLVLYLRIYMLGIITELIEQLDLPESA